MASIYTLVDDIYQLIENSPYPDGEEDSFISLVKSPLLNESSFNLVLNTLYRERKVDSLRFSNMGVDCSRRLYHIKNKSPTDKLTGDVYMKFDLGHFAESYVLALAHLSGHKVEYTQRELNYRGVEGHCDAVIDGMLVDIKTAHPFAVSKFKKGLTEENDGFGYLRQLGRYLMALNEEGLVKYPDKAAFLIYDKGSSKLHLDIHDFDVSKEKIMFDNAIEKAESVNEPPKPSWAKKSHTFCQYCPVKTHCYRKQ